MTGRFALLAFDVALAAAGASPPVEPVDSGETVTAFLAGASIASFLLSLAVLVAYGAKVWQNLPLDNHAALFRDLCAAHGLEAEDRETLLDAAAAAQIRGVEVFVRPEALSELADRLEDPDAKSRCWRLRRRLFGDLKVDPQDEFVA